MSRHIADHPREGSKRAEKYTQIEREEGAAGPHEASKALQQRPSTPPETTQRTAEYLRVERGHKA